MATIIIEPTEACNATCAYCYVVGREPAAAKSMSLETLELVFVQINEYLSERPREILGILWHGGEPLLAGPKYFAAAVDFQRRHCPGLAPRIRHAIQSNLTVMTTELAKLLKELGIKTVGSSCDPCTDLRGLGRSRDAGAYERRYREGLEILGKEGLEAGVIYTVTRLVLDRPLDVFRKVTALPVTGPIDFNPVVVLDERARALGVTGAEFAEFLGAIFPEWWSNRERYREVGPFSLLVQNLREGVRRLPCRESGRCAHLYVNVSPDGRLSQCNRSSECSQLDYGHLGEKTLAQALADPRRKPLLARNRLLYEGECKGCRFWPICHGGCPMDSFLSTGSLMHRSPFCEAKKTFIERHVEPLIGGCPGLPNPV